ncbi:MAG: hypothetical protein ABWZ29_09370 [Casimicrobiaceae bacterium]
MPAADDRTRAHVSAAFRHENVADLGGDEEMNAIVASGPRGAIALAGLTVAMLVAIWLAFFVFIFLPRGAVG